MGEVIRTEIGLLTCYECVQGQSDIHSLILGRAITGIQAFV